MKDLQQSPWQEVKDPVSVSNISFFCSGTELAFQLYLRLSILLRQWRSILWSVVWKAALRSRPLYLLMLTCCSIGLGLVPSGLCGRNSSRAGPLLSSCSRRRDLVPGGCSHWRTVSRCSNTQLHMASDVKLRSLRGKICRKKKTNGIVSIRPKWKSNVTSISWFQHPFLGDKCLPTRS